MAIDSTPLSHAERGHLGGLKRAAVLNPEQRRKVASSGHLAASVSAVVNRAPELTPEQFSRLRALFGPGGIYGG